MFSMVKHGSLIMCLKFSNLSWAPSIFFYSISINIPRAPYSEVLLKFRLRDCNRFWGLVLNGFR